MKLTAVFRSKSIGFRLSLLIVLNSSLALMLAGIALYGFENFEQRKAATRELLAQADILAESSTAALSFNDERAAGQTLAALKGDSHVVEANIYDRNNRIFARYQRVHSSRPSGLMGFRAKGVYFEDGVVLVFQPIQLDGERIGTIFLQSTNEVESRLRRYVGVVCVVLLMSLGLALLLSSRLQRSITEPISRLSEVARGVSHEKNYSVRAVPHNGGEIGLLIDSFNDMLSQIEVRELARKKAEESLRESEERYALAARGANDGLWDWKLATDEVFYSSRWSQMLGLSESDHWSDQEEWFSRVHPSDHDRLRAEIAAHLGGTTSELVTEYRMRHKNGSFIWVLSRGIAVRNANGTAVRIAGSQTDITEGKVGDPLTGLPNRLYFVDKLEAAIDAAAHGGLPFAVLFLDLDRFKLVNDSLGHVAGDQLLTGVAEGLRSSVRGEWTAGHYVIARLGGDEFAILLTEIQVPANVVLVAQRILKKFEVPFHLDGHAVFATVSVGIAPSSSGNTAEDLLRNADTAMYYAKARGKARFEFFDDGMRERAIARLQIEAHLRKAIAGQQLVLHYQPQLDLGTQSLKGYEALVRWNHPERGLLAPGEFIPIAEESDLIVHLGRWVLREACSQMAEWHRRFAFDPQPTISVNVSAKQFNDPEFIGEVQETLSETGLDPKCLKLEMTEGSVMSNPEMALATLDRLKLMNVGLEIDDFGTGYSSLSYLQRLPFDTLKVDRSFVKDLGAREEGSEIVRTIIELARSLRMDVIAEGVETEDQLRQLTCLGCDCIQGYWFSKPLDAGTAEAAMVERISFSHIAGLTALARHLGKSADAAAESRTVPPSGDTNVKDIRARVLLDPDLVDSVGRFRIDFESVTEPVIEIR